MVQEEEAMQKWIYACEQLGVSEWPPSTDMEIEEEIMQVPTVPLLQMVSVWYSLPGIRMAVEALT